MIDRSRRRWGRGRGYVLAAALVVCLVPGVALWRYVEQLGPLDLTAAGSRSTVVLDRDGRLLRPFATAEGRWRLPIKTGDVDPRYLAMLDAYEDARFERHGGEAPADGARRSARTPLLEG